ncbi:MAG: restriction endonuclease subunit S [Hyphomicrobiales bacterium]|nr:restriction endonuclease subunit S [Hyphomicrobiales bacterium]
MLKRIAAEKAQLVKAGEIRKSRPIAHIADDELLFDLSPGWVWVRLGQLSQFVTSGSRDWAKYYADEGAIFVRMGNLSKDDYRLRLNSIQRVSPPSSGEGTRTRLEGGDILISITGDVGMLGLIPDDFGEAYINQHTAMVRPMPEMKGRYLPELFRSPFAQDQFNAPQRGIKNSFRLTDVTQFIVPLPPLAEQRRIVAKMDELMALLDRLEATRTAREATRDRLTAASLARLTAPETDDEAFPAHARFALDALPALTARPDQIKHLRQSILNLAVRGKLVEQDPADEPASELLKRIATAKAAAQRETGDARIKPAPSPDPDALQMELPPGWSAESFENLFLFIDYRGKTPPKTTEGTPLITAKNVRMGSLDREPREFIAENTFKTWMTRGFPQLGDLFFTTEAPLANICINDIEEPFALAQRVICFQPYAEIDTRYLMFAIMSDVIQSLLEEHSTGLTAKGIKAAKLKPLPLPIPPLAEQHRIVAKMDALMILCNRLEAALATADATCQRLLEALLHEALFPAPETVTKAAE